MNLKNSKLKIAHARKLLEKFAAEYKFFINENYQLIKEVNKETESFKIKLQVKNSIPEEWGLFIGDIIHNTRASLDLLISDLLILNGNQVTKMSAFPIYETEEDFLKFGPKKIAGIDEKASLLIKGLNPFKEGNPKLWQLHQLDILDKHRLMIPIVSENKAIVMDFSERFAQLFGQERVGNVPSMPIGLRPAEREVSDGMVLFSADKTFSEPTFEFELTFGEGEILKGESISKSLNEFIVLVETLISDLESLHGS